MRNTYDDENTMDFDPSIMGSKESINRLINIKVEDEENSPVPKSSSSASSFESMS